MLTSQCVGQRSVLERGETREAEKLLRQGAQVLLLCKALGLEAACGCSEAAAGTEATEANTADVWEDISIHQPVYVRLPVLWTA